MLLRIRRNKITADHRRAIALECNFLTLSSSPAVGTSQSNNRSIIGISTAETAEVGAAAALRCVATAATAAARIAAAAVPTATSFGYWNTLPQTLTNPGTHRQRHDSASLLVALLGTGTVEQAGAPPFAARPGHATRTTWRGERTHRMDRRSTVCALPGQMVVLARCAVEWTDTRVALLSSWALCAFTHKSPASRKLRGKSFPNRPGTTQNWGRTKYPSPVDKQDLGTTP